jgi:hypothetical protein
VGKAEKGSEGISNTNEFGAATNLPHHGFRQIGFLNTDPKPERPPANK